MKKKEQPIPAQTEVIENIEEKVLETLERTAAADIPGQDGSENAKSKKSGKKSSNLLSDSTRFFVREAYKTLRTNVTFALTDGVNSKVIMITSAVQGEGKSTTATNLAISYAEMGKRVLIIDCDMRRPKLARLLDLKPTLGLSELLLDSSLIEKAILPSGITNLDVVTSGAIPPNPSELLGTDQMQKFLSKMREQYDLVMIDSPPITMVTDALVLAPNCDGTMLIVRASHTDRGAVAFAIEQLSHAKAKVLGFIFNGVGLDKTSYGFSKNRYKRYRKSYSRYGYGGYGYGGYGGYGYGGYGYGGYGYGGYGGYGYGERPHHQPEQTPAAKQNRKDDKE